MPGRETKIRQYQEEVREANFEKISIVILIRLATKVWKIEQNVLISDVQKVTEYSECQIIWHLI